MARLNLLLLGQLKIRWRTFLARGTSEITGVVLLFIACAAILERVLLIVPKFQNSYVLIALSTVWIASTAGIEPAKTLRQFPLSNTDFFVIRLVNLATNPFTSLLIYATLSIGRTSPAAYLVSAFAIFFGLTLAGFLFSKEQGSTKPRRSPALLFRGLLHKDVAATLRLPEIWLPCIFGFLFIGYMCSTPNPEIEAVWSCPVIIVLFNITQPLNLFGFDGRSGLDRYLLLPLTGRQILESKVRANAIVVATELVPIVAIVFWRIGIRAGLATLTECLSLGLILLAFGAINSVRHPYVLTPYRFVEGGSVFAALFASLLCLAPGFVAASENRWLAATLFALAIVALHLALNWAGHKLTDDPEVIRSRLN